MHRICDRLTRPFTNTNRYKEEAKRANARVEALIHRVNKAESERDLFKARKESEAVTDGSLLATAAKAARLPTVTQESFSQTAPIATLEHATNTEEGVKEEADLTVTSANFLYHKSKGGGSSEDSGVPPNDSEGSLSTADNNTENNQQVWGRNT